MANNTFRADVITNWGEFKALGDEWNELLHETNAHSIFLTWEWVTSCGEAARWKMDPFVVVVWDNDNKLVGVAPLYIKSYRLVGVVPIRVLRLLPDVVNGSEYLDFIAHNQFEDSIYRAIFSKLKEYEARWDLMWICRISGWSGALSRLRNSATAESIKSNMRRSSFSAMPLPKSFSEFMMRLSSKSRSQLRREMRRVFDPPEIWFTTCSKHDEIPIMLDALFSLHAERWQSVGQQGSFARAPTEARFHSIFAPIALRNGWLRLSTVTETDKIRAVQIGYLYDHVFNSLQEGFSPEYSSGVGNALRGRIIEETILEGAEEYDFLGGHSDHKKRWSATERFGGELLLYGKSFLGTFIGIFGIWPTGRYLNPSS